MEWISSKGELAAKELMVVAAAIVGILVVLTVNSEIIMGTIEGAAQSLD